MMLLGGLQGLSASYGKGSQNSTAKDTANKESTVYKENFHLIFDYPYPVEDYIKKMIYGEV